MFQKLANSLNGVIKRIQVNKSVQEDLEARMVNEWLRIFYILYFIYIFLRFQQLWTLFYFPGNHSASLYLHIRGTRERTLKASRLLS
jgi:hypothetical protein